MRSVSNHYGGILAAILAVVMAPALHAEQSGQSVAGALDIGLTHADSGLDSWLRGGQGKLRFDAEHDGPQFVRGFIDYTGRVIDTVRFHATLNAQDAASHVIDITEGYLEWRPVPVTAWRLRTRIGAFYPKLSLENVAAGWSSPYTLSSSAINTWIGEELRAVGAEVRVTRDMPFLPAGNTLSAEGAIFFANDPAGGLLAARGWAIHDRQTGLFSSIPLPPVSAIEPWTFEPEQPAALEPFREIDGRPGFYAGLEWQWSDRFRVKYLHYDNHANPTAEGVAGYAWQLWFDHVGAQVELPAKIGLIGQWITGASRAGEDLGPWRVFDSDFQAWYVLLTRSFGQHRISVRYDKFDYTPNNDPGDAVNLDQGHAWTASYLYQLSQRWRIAAEYLVIDTRHCNPGAACSWVAHGLPASTREEQLQLGLRWAFGI